MLIAVLPLLFPASLPLPAQPLQADAPPSIEELIARYNARAEAATEALREEVDYLLKQLLSHAKSDRRNSMDEVRAQLIALGSAVGPLLVPSIDPGRKATRTDLSFATQVAMVLEEISLLPVHDALMHKARNGASTGSRLAIRILGHSEDPNRISPFLKELYTNSETPPRATILTALAHLSRRAAAKDSVATENLSFITDRLHSEERTEIDAALTALTVAAVTEASDAILTFSSEVSEAAPHVDHLCAWYGACPSAFDKAHGSSVLALARSPRVKLEDRILLINILTTHEQHWPSGTKKTLEGMADSGNKDLREAVLIALALSGSRSAKKELLAPYELSHARNYRWADATIDLATIEYKIHEYRDAIRHYEAAMKMGRIDTRRQRDVYLGLARCYACEKKYRDAQTWLQRAPISRKQLAALATDPDFIEMASHSRYASAFGNN